MYEWSKEKAELVLAKFPRLWKLCQPHRIAPPAGYPNPKYFSLQAWAALMMMERSEMNQLSHINAQMLAAQLVRHRMPTYFVEPEFALAVAQTKPPEGFKLQDIKFPLDAMLFVLHDDFVKDYFGWNIPFLAVCRYPVGNFPFSLGWPFDHTWEQNMEIERGKITANWNSVDRFIYGAAAFIGPEAPLDYNGSFPLTQNASAMRGKTVDSTAYEALTYFLCHGELLYKNDPTTPEIDQEIQDKLGALAVKLMLAITARPAMISTGTITRKAREKHGKIRDELWSPNMVGANYRIRHPGGLGGTHAAPGLHWRSGHYTHQPCGLHTQILPVSALPHTPDGKIIWEQVDSTVHTKFWASHKLIWIDPVLVLLASPPGKD